MVDKLEAYRRADASLPDCNRLWPLYGAGFENLGHEGQPIKVPMPEYGPDELLVRHDVCGLCFSDTKVIAQGEVHPRIFRDMRAHPVVLGHEVSVTVVGVGENLRARYHVGDRFAIQPANYVDGVNLAYGYEIEGALAQYAVIDHRLLKGDAGNCLIPVQPTTGYAESALTEPWACIVASYGVTCRTKLKPGGTTWIIGGSVASEEPYTISAGFDEDSHPGRLLLTDVPADFASWLRGRARALGVEVIEVDDITAPPVGPVDDIVLLGASPEIIQTVSSYLANSGIIAILDDEPLTRDVDVDVGRLHYDSVVYVGGPGPDIARAYSDVPVRSELKPGGRAWFVGAGGPMGQMHIQRAIEAPNGPKTIFATALSDRRLSAVRSLYEAEAEAKDIGFTCISRADEAAYLQTLETIGAAGFDDIIVLAPSVSAVAEAANYVAPRGVINIFFGMPHGTMARVNLSDVYIEGVRFIGHSGSTIDDMRLTLHQAESGRLSPNRSVAAVGSLSAARDGLQTVKDAVYPGKVLIYPHIKDLPITALQDLKGILPSVYAELKGGREWTVEAEQELLRVML